jgi:signal transduction histidine kinase
MNTFSTAPKLIQNKAFRLFGNLRIRPKMLLLHNIFFVLLSLAVYFSVIPPFEKRVASAKQQEFVLLGQLFADDRYLPALQDMGVYQYRQGDAASLALSSEAVQYLEENPTRTYLRPQTSDTLVRRAPIAGLYRAVTIPEVYYDGLVFRAKYTLWIVLAILYFLAIIILETMVMPAFVYRPIQCFLDADAASRQNDRAQELIPEEEILNDEIGRIMISRNETMARLRAQEDDLQRQNQELEVARHKLLEQDRLASLGLLSASVAHELNTPLAVLIGSIEKLSEETQTPQTQARLARMLKMAQRLRKISESLVGFSRVRREDVEAVGVHALIEEAWQIASIDEKASRIHFENLCDPAHAVIGNADRLLQVFLNLIRNAMQAVSADGHIQVRSGTQQKSWVSIRVEDDGPGIPADVLPDIFDAFVSTRLDSKGTGLGLTVSEGIVHQHGGTISAANRPQGGACLEVRLQQHLPKEPGAAEESPSTGVA